MAGTDGDPIRSISRTALILAGIGAAIIVASGTTDEGEFRIVGAIVLGIGVMLYLVAQYQRGRRGD